jgi:plasmid maintenance system antidote protein VapI
MNTHTIGWNLSGLAGHDHLGNEISVRELVAALEGYEQILSIVNLSDSMRDSLAKQAAESYRIKMQNEHQQRTISELESALNNAHARASNLLNEHADIQKDVAISALAKYADPRNWANPRNQYGDLQTDQCNVFIKGFHGYELAILAMSVIQLNKEQAA